MRLVSATLALFCSTGALLPALSSPALNAQGSCLPAQNSQVRELLAYTRHLAASSRTEGARTSLGIPRMDSLKVVVVTDRALCSRAADLIGPHNRGRSAVVTLIQLDTLYWVEDVQKRAGEYIPGFIVDRTISQIISRPFR